MTFTSLTAGTFQLAFDGQVTAAIAYNASAATVDAALELLDSIDGVTVSTSTSGNNRTYTVTFAGTHANTNVALLQAAVKTTGNGSHVRNMNFFYDDASRLNATSDPSAIYQ